MPGRRPPKRSAAQPSSLPPRDRAFADPCLVDRGGSSYLFFEELRFAENKGFISCCELTPDGRTTPPEIVLERPYHLSYPFVFFVGDDAYMLPETAANRTDRAVQSRIVSKRLDGSRRPSWMASVQSTRR